MRSSTALLLSLPVAAMALATRKPDVVLRALYPRQSTGACTYTCPETDLNENKNQNSMTTGNTLICGYGTENCGYDTSSGLYTGTDVACPSAADSTGCAERRHATYKRETNYTAMLRRTAARQEAKRAQQAARRAAREAEQLVQESARATERAERAVEEAERMEQMANRAAMEAESTNKR